MMPTIQIGLTKEAEELLKRVKQIPKATLRGIARGQDKANQETVGIITRDFLSFPKTGPSTLEGLRVQSGDYRRSLRASKAVIQGETVQSGIGSNVRSKGGVSYPRVHEFGFRGTVQVPAHTRKPGRSFMLGGKIIGQRAAGQFLTKGGKPRKKSSLVEIHETRAVLIDVKAHSMKVNLPARAPIRRGIIRNLERTRELVSTEIIKSISVFCFLLSAFGGPL